jgi:polymorphic toxin system DSP-PTPase phosphatase-like protein
MSRLFWIEIDGPGRLAIMARPRAGDWLDGEVDAWKTSGIDMVVSLLEPQEVLELELQREADLCGARGIDFVSFPIPDRGVPDRDGATQMARALAARLRERRAIAIHCRAGIGRSSIMAACVLIMSGIEAERALALIKGARGLNVPDTDEQRDWVMAFGKAVARHGAKQNAGLIAPDRGPCGSPYGLRHCSGVWRPRSPETG